MLLNITTYFNTSTVFYEYIVINLHNKRYQTHLKHNTLNSGTNAVPIKSITAARKTLHY